jgi:hypothetical protein
MTGKKMLHRRSNVTLRVKSGSGLWIKYQQPMSFWVKGLKIYQIANKP